MLPSSEPRHHDPAQHDGYGAGDRDVFENVTPYDKALMSTQRLDANSFVGHADIINDDGKPAVVEVTYRRLP